MAREGRGLDLVSLGELLVEFVRKGRGEPHTVVGEYVGPFPSGAPAITVDAAARLGLRTGFIGVVGDDDFGAVVLNRFRSDGVDASRIRVARGYTTGIAFVTYDREGNRRFVFHMRYSAAALLSPQDVDEGYVASARALHISGSSLSISGSVYEACRRALEIARGHGLYVTFDPNVRLELANPEELRRLHEPFIRSADAVLLGGDEARVLMDVESPVDAARAILDMGPRVVVLKLGPRGSAAVTRSGVVEVPAYLVEEVDPTGAGDVFNAAFIYGVLTGWDLEKVLRFANAAAAVKVKRRGPMEGPRSLGEVEEVLRRGVLRTSLRTSPGS